MRRRSGSKAARSLRPLAYSYTAVAGFAFATATIGVANVVAQQAPLAPAAEGISREVKEVFARSAKAVVKIRATDKHGKLSGTGFFIDPAGTLYTAFSVGADADDFTVEFDGKEIPARQVMADRRSGISLLKVDMPTPALPIGSSRDLEVATPVLTVGFPLDLPQTPSFGMIAGFDRKFLGRYFSTTHLRVNLPTQRGEAGAPLLNFKGEVVGILVSSVDNSSACYALPIDAAEKIRSDFVRFGEARHGWIGINVADAAKEVEGSRAQFTDIMPGTPAAESGARPGDVLLQVGRTPVSRPEDVIDASFFITAGDKVPITVMRGEQKLVFEVEADFHPAAQRPPVIASPLSPQAMPLGLDRTP
jgi:serine protease Do